MTAAAALGHFGSMDAPTVGTRVEVLRYSDTGDFFVPAAVVDCLIDPVYGMGLVVQIENEKEFQRLWPTPGIRIARAAKRPWTTTRALSSTMASGPHP